VVLSQRFSAKTKADPFFDLPRVAGVNPSPYLFYLQLNDVYVVGSSPEMLVKVQGRDGFTGQLPERGGAGRMKPKTSGWSAKCSPAKKSARNTLCWWTWGETTWDVYAITGPCGRKIDDCGALLATSCSRLQLAGQLREDVDCFDALMSCFPAGTVSGAPKVRAMEIIEELEKTRRGIYARGHSLSRFRGQFGFVYRLAHYGHQKWCGAHSGGRGQSLPTPRPKANSTSR